MSLRSKLQRVPVHGASTTRGATCQDAIQSEAMRRLLELDEVVTWQREVACARAQLAARLEPAIRTAIGEMSVATLAEKRALCDALHKILDDLGLCVRCPKTGAASRLAHDSSHRRRHGRFLFVALQSSPGQRRKRSFCCASLPKIQLMARPSTGLPDDSPVR